jgi:hypothetical protein
MNLLPLITLRERRVTIIAALLLTLAILLGATLCGNRLRMLIAITHWQDDASITASTSGTISVSRLGCPFALAEDESASITATVSNDWTREVGIEVTFYTEDLSNGPPYAYISSEPLCEPVLVNVAPKKTADVTCAFAQKTVSQGMMMPLAIKARTVIANFGPNDYDSAACPIWIIGMGGVNGDLIANVLGLISLLGMVVSGAAWSFWGYFPGERRAMIASVLLWLAGGIVAVGTIIYVIHEVASCVFVVGLVIAGVAWAVTRDRRRTPIRSIYE